jgi:hypothetical protein
MKFDLTEFVHHVDHETFPVLKSCSPHIVASINVICVTCLQQISAFETNYIELDDRRTDRRHESFSTKDERCSTQWSLKARERAKARFA